MSLFHQKKHAWISRAVAVLLFAVLTQTLVAAMLHVALVDHIWCESHGDFEHASSDGAHDDEDTTPERIAHADLQRGALPVDPGDDHLPEDPRSPGDLCFYLSTVYGPAIPLPPLLDSLTNLPPPAEPAAAAIPQRRAMIPLQIDTLHQSPGLSPPQRMA